MLCLKSLKLRNKRGFIMLKSYNFLFSSRNIPNFSSKTLFHFAALPSASHIAVTPASAEQLKREMIRDFDLVPQVTCFSGKLWTRIDANIYSVQDDYLRLRD